MKAKKVIKRFFVMALSFCFLLGGTSCAPSEPEIPEWSTSLTSEQHLENLAYSTELLRAEWRERGMDFTYDLEIVYSYDEKPRFFLVTMEFLEEQTFDWPNVDEDDEEYLSYLYTTKYAYIMGNIPKDDQYGYVLDLYGCVESLRLGPHPWAFRGVASEKKYWHLNEFAIKEDDKLTRVYKRTTNDRLEECSWCYEPKDQYDIYGCVRHKDWRDCTYSGMVEAYEKVVLTEDAVRKAKETDYTVSSRGNRYPDVIYHKDGAYRYTYIYER